MKNTLEKFKKAKKTIWDEDKQFQDKLESFQEEYRFFAVNKAKNLLSEFPEFDSVNVLLRSIYNDEAGYDTWISLKPKFSEEFEKELKKEENKKTLWDFEDLIHDGWLIVGCMLFGSGEDLDEEKVLATVVR